MSASSIAGIADSDRVRSSLFVTRPGPPSPAPGIVALLVAIWRAVAVSIFSIVALSEISLKLLFVRRECRLHARAEWLHRWCLFACRVLGIHVATSGRMLRSGLLVCNHLSYLDIIVLSSITPCVFVAKRDVAAWPLFGWLARAAGTIFADRRRKLRAGGVVDLVRDAIAGGALVVLFPEGTSSDGESVLPFKSALLESALQAGCMISAAAIDYSLSYGSVADEICYWRDMTLIPHLLNLFTKRGIDSRLVVRPFNGSGANRKEIARQLRSQVITMRS
jgi:1-acyl-sn-glycerol-3-phosphate acyltransferase